MESEANAYHIPDSAPVKISDYVGQVKKVLLADTPNKSREITRILENGMRDFDSKDHIIELLIENDVILLDLAKQNMTEVFEFLGSNDMMARLNLNRVDSQGLTALHFAVRNQNLSMVRNLLSNPSCDADIRDNLLDQSPIHELFSGWLRPRRSQLLSSNEDIESMENCQYSEEVFQVLELLLPRCNPNVLCRGTKENILHRLAPRTDKLACLVLDWLLHSYGDVIDLNIQNGWGETPLMVALEACNLKTATILLQSGTDLFLYNKFRETALHIASRKNQYKLVKMMLGKACPISFKDFEGNTALHFAASRGFHLVANALLNLAESTILNVTNSKGETPLHLAVEGGFSEIAELLANRGSCNLEARTTGNNLSALQIAQLESRPNLKSQIVGILTSAATAKASMCARKGHMMSHNRHSNSSLDSTSTFGEYSNAMLIS